MLLSEPRRERDARAGDRENARGGADVEPHEDAVWIMLGGLDRALLQAGIVSRLLEAGRLPTVVIASGFAVTNAVLIAGARRDGFARRWEQLRAGRFLVSAALGNIRVLGALNGMFDDLSALLAELAHARPSGAASEPEVLVATEDGFSSLPHDSATLGWRTAVKRSLRYTSESPPLLAGAIREAATRARCVLVLGLERTMQSHPDVDAAVRATRAEGARVTFVTAAMPRRAGLFDYLLPGSGAPERLMREGCSAAERSIVGVDRNGSSRPGQVPLSGSGGGVAAGFSEPPEAEGGLWSNDANDASNWPK
jgi:hypothetical protein